MWSKLSALFYSRHFESIGDEINEKQQNRTDSSFRKATKKKRDEWNISNDAIEIGIQLIQWEMI